MYKKTTKTLNIHISLNKIMADKKEKVEENVEEVEKVEGEGGGNALVMIGIVIVALIILVYAYTSITGNAIFGFDGFGSNEVRIGFMGPLTGDAASYGHAIKRGVEMALKDSKLQNVKIIYEDTRCDGEEAVSAINKLINIDKVSAIIGDVCSGATLAVAPIAEQNKVVMISASSTSPEITNAGEYIFRTIPSDTHQGKFGAELVYDLGLRNLSILYGNEEYGVGFEGVLKENFESLGGLVVAEESFERGSTDLRTQLTKIRKARPEAIYIISNSPDSSVAALKQIKQMGIKAKVFGSEGLKGPEIAATKVAENLTITSVSAGTPAFVEQYMREHGLAIQPFAPQAYDSFNALAKAIQNGARTGSEIKLQLDNLKFSGVSGDIEFDSNGDVSGSYQVYRLVNGTFVLADY